MARKMDARLIKVFARVSYKGIDKKRVLFLNDGCWHEWCAPYCGVAAIAMLCKQEAGSHNGVQGVLKGEVCCGSS